MKNWRLCAVFSDSCLHQITVVRPFESMTVSRSFALCLCLAAFLSGCGDKNKKDTLYKVTGKVTKDGTGLKDIGVTFHPVDGGAPSSGSTNENGEFTLTYSKGGEGAIAGKHKVVLTVQTTEDYMSRTKGKSGTTDPQKAKSPVPHEYRDQKTTKKEVEVTEDGDNNFTIEL